MVVFEETGGHKDCFCNFWHDICEYLSSHEDVAYYLEDDPEYDDDIDEEFQKFIQEQDRLYQWKQEKKSPLN